MLLSVLLLQFTQETPSHMSNCDRSLIKLPTLIAHGGREAALKGHHPIP